GTGRSVLRPPQPCSGQPTTRPVTSPRSGFSKLTFTRGSIRTTSPSTRTARSSAKGVVIGRTWTSASPGAGEAAAATTGTRPSSGTPLSTPGRGGGGSVPSAHAPAPTATRSTAPCAHSTSSVVGAAPSPSGPTVTARTPAGAPSSSTRRAASTPGPSAATGAGGAIAGAARRAERSA